MKDAKATKDFNEANILLHESDICKQLLIQLYWLDKEHDA